MTGCLYRVQVAQEVRIATIFLDLAKSFLHRGKDAVNMLVAQLVKQLIKEESLGLYENRTLDKGVHTSLADSVNVL